MDYDFGGVQDGWWAHCRWNVVGRRATLALTDKSWPADVGKPDPIEHAWHEAAELLIAPLNSMLRTQLAEERVAEATHQVIRRIEKLLARVS